MIVKILSISNDNQRKIDILNQISLLNIGKTIELK